MNIVNRGVAGQSLGWYMRNCFQSPLEGHSETSNDQAPLNPFDHYIKIKAYMRVEDTLPRGRFIGTK